MQTQGKQVIMHMRWLTSVHNDILPALIVAMLFTITLVVSYT